MLSSEARDAATTLHRLIALITSREREAPPSETEDLAKQALESNRALLEALESLVVAAPPDENDLAFSSGGHAGSYGRARTAPIGEDGLTPGLPTSTQITSRLATTQREIVNLLQECAAGDTTRLPRPSNRLSRANIDRREKADSARQRLETAACHYLFGRAGALEVALDPHTVYRP